MKRVAKFFGFARRITLRQVNFWLVILLGTAFIISLLRSFKSDRGFISIFVGDLIYGSVFLFFLISFLIFASLFQKMLSNWVNKKISSEECNVWKRNIAIKLGGNEKGIACIFSLPLSYAVSYPLILFLKSITILGMKVFS